jgi:hypothetical protein
LVLVYFFKKKRTETSQLEIENTLWDRDFIASYVSELKMLMLNSPTKIKTLPAAAFIAPGFVSENEEYVPGL